MEVTPNCAHLILPDLAYLLYCLFQYSTAVLFRTYLFSFCTIALAFHISVSDGYLC